MAPGSPGHSWEPGHRTVRSALDSTAIESWSGQGLGHERKEYPTGHPWQTTAAASTRGAPFSPEGPPPLGMASLLPSQRPQGSVRKSFLKVPSPYTLVSDLAMDSVFEGPWPRLLLQPVLPFPPSFCLTKSFHFQSQLNATIIMLSGLSSQPIPMHLSPTPCHNYLAPYLILMMTLSGLRH